MGIWFLAFFNTTSSAGLSGTPTGALAIFDFDGDGDLDALVASPEPGETKLLLNQGGFFREASAGLLPGLASLYGVDYDLDGDLDLVGASSSPGSPPLILKNEGTGLREVPLGLSGGKCTRLVLPLDYDCDSWPDLLEAGTPFIAEGGCRLWKGSGAGFVGADLGELENPELSVFSVAVGNLDQDPEPEVVLAVSGGLWAYDFRGQFLWRAEGEFRGVRVADVDGDGSPEVIAASERGVCVVSPDGSGKCRGLGLQQVPPLRDLAVADFDLDGRADVLCVAEDGKVLLLRATGEGFEDATDREGLGEISGVKGAVFGDYDSDGDPDLFLLTEDGVKLLENEHQPTEVLKVRLEGALPGDEVRAYASEKTLSYVVGQASTSLCYSPPEVSFSGNQWDSLVVFWSCGERTVKLKPRGVITLVNPRKPTEVQREEENLIKVTPNPAVGIAVFVYQVPEAGPVEVRVVNSQGNTVKVVERGYKSPGTYWAKWDGTDNSGRVVPKGIYFVHYSFKGKVWRQKLVWVPF